MASVDIKDAYYSVPLGKNVKGSYTCLPNGLCTAMDFTQQWTAQQWTLHSNGLCTGPGKCTKLLSVLLSCLQQKGHIE